MRSYADTIGNLAKTCPEREFLNELLNEHLAREGVHPLVLEYPLEEKAEMVMEIPGPLMRWTEFLLEKLKDTATQVKAETGGDGNQ